MRKIFLSALTIILIATSCKKDDPVEVNTNSDSNLSNLGDNAELVKELQNYAPTAQNQTKNSDKIITFTTEKGNELIFPARAFVDGSGNLVNGNVDVSVTEITNVSEMILSGKMTNSNQGPLSSQGEFNVEVSQNGQPLELAEGSTFTIENKNAEVDEDMKGWVWKENQTVSEAIDNNGGEWIRNEFDENNPCERIQSLWAAFQSNSSYEHTFLWKDIKPIKDLVFTEINKIIPLNDETFGLHINGSEDSYQRMLDCYNSNNLWEIYDQVDDEENPNFILGNGTIPNESYNYYVDGDFGLEINNCTIYYESSDSTWQSHNLNPNVINITFSQLSWCNIDRLLNEYDQINSCKLKGNFPDHAQVKIVFRDLNGALSCDFSDDGFVAKRLPEGYDLMFLVYFKDGDAIKFGTQTITASQEMTFNEENLKTLSNINELVEEIEKIVD